jgi:peptide-methionine (S)-S-oxide reductase
VGYTGGTAPSPTYRSIGDHTESVWIEFDPAIITYEQLLKEFWEAHNPEDQSPSRQYRNMVHFQTETQRAAAEASRTAIEERSGVPVATDIVPATRFYVAEDYHQKYYLRSDRRWSVAVAHVYDSADGLRDSTLAARLNGCLAGYCTRDQLRQEQASYGLTDEGNQALERLVRTTR